jgi:O-methyltransferase
MSSANGFPPDFEARDIEIIRAVEPYTMTSTERIYALINAVRHIASNRVPGGLVECGVWKGGSVMAMALTLLQIGQRDRSLYLFDTFSGMTPPTDRDVDYQGQEARVILDDVRFEASREEVEDAVSSTGYDREKIHFVKGPVEETIPTHAPEAIALLRLDTDWYESTQHELLHLFPRLARGGVIIVDDYGHWRGARQAVDEYLAQNQIPLLLQRIDYTGRIGVKL